MLSYSCNMYLNENELLPSVQSAYRQFFSTETAVLKVVSDILTAMDRGQITLLDMFDLSASFDTINHAILLKQLDVSFGFPGNALNWFVSYLSGRSQKVSVHGILASSCYLDFGVPQGSMLGPVLFFFARQILLHWYRALVFLHMSFLMTYRYIVIFLMGRNRLLCNFLGIFLNLWVVVCLPTILNLIP